MAKKKTTVKEYEVLIPCRNDKTGNSYIVGCIVTRSDFPIRVLKSWTEDTDPPVLKEI